ncbi:MAG: GNAT family N-acetyltransferase, partial [Caldilineaceae bacterium]
MSHSSAAGPTLHLEVHDRPYGDELVAISQGLHTFNLAQMPSLRQEPWAFVLRGEDGSVRGGVYGITYAGCAMIVLIWVEPALRGRGLGRALLQRAHAHAARNGALFTFAEVMDFRAP